MPEATKELLEKYGETIINRESLDSVRREICKKYTLTSLPNSDILKEYRFLLQKNKINRNELLEGILRKRTIRTMSGVAPVAVLTRPYPCPGTCAYCPHEADVPTSYLSNEPAVMRAIRCGYDPYKQVILRLKALENNGHHPNKIELIVIGGTWSYLPTKYKYWYILNCFKAVNDYQKKKIDLGSTYRKNLRLEDFEMLLTKEQTRNEKAKYQLIGLTLETRPDYIDKEEVLEMRKFGCTRVEMGVQIVDDRILKINKRGHGIKEIAEATKLLKDYGFKVTYHLMPALPGATPAKDFKLFQKLFIDPRFQPDQIKLYPTVVTQGSLLYRWYKRGKYKPYSDKVLQNLIMKCKNFVPRYVRIIRLIRDIPGESIVAGNKITNLRQIMQDKGVKCECIRCREARDKKIEKYKINIIRYAASDGMEYFISADSLNGKTLYGFCRLRIQKDNELYQAFIRELHVYGELVPIGQKKKVQHQGLGKELMSEAERIVRKNKINKLTIISGVGVRGYYKKLGYKLKDTYMIKSL